MLLQVILQADDAHAIDARTTSICPHLPQCGRLSLFPSRISGFTRQRRREVQFHLDVLLLVVRETHGLLTAPSRSGLRPSFPAWPIHCSAFRLSECLTSLADVMT